jgi:amphi-Trp domain-containing protein
MKRSRQELRVDGAVELPHVISYLEQLVTALKSGVVRVHRGEEQVVLGPRGVVGFSLAATERGKRQRLSLELSWRKYAAPDADIDLTIAPAAELPPAAEVVAPETATAETSAPEVTPAESEPTTSGPGEVILGEAD